MRDVIIVGSGPAGYTAAIYAARANLEPILITSSVETGGELMKTTEVENFPGFPEGVQGPDLMVAMHAQAEKFGTELITDDAVALDLHGPVKRVTLGNGDLHEARSVIIATGSAYRHLGVEGEERLSGQGVSWCATCDGFFFRQKVVAVVGGGDSAMEEATFLTKFASKVYLIHRSTTLRASAAMQDRARNDPKIEFLLDRQVAAVIGDERVTGLALVDGQGASSVIDVDGLFVAIGADPRVDLVRDVLELTPQGTIAVEGRSSRTSVAGVFAAGDVVDPTYKQAVTAAASGCIAALDVEKFLAELADSARV